MMKKILVIIFSVYLCNAEDSVPFKNNDDEWVSSVRESCFDPSRKDCIEKDWYMLPHPNISEPYSPPFMPFTIGNEGPIQSSAAFNFETEIIKLIEQISDEFSNPDVISGQHTLSKFNTVVHLLKAASETQLHSLTTQLYVKLSSSADNERYRMWVIFRDAVIQAGTGPSIISLLNWTRSELVYGEEAAQLVSTITNTAEFPTEEFMKIFFAIVKDADRNERIYLNSSSVLAFSSLIKKVYVCKKSMAKRFPIYSFGNPTAKVSNAFNSIYMPYLTTKFYDAVKEGDSHKIQIYIRALGNTAHPSILNVFSSYISGVKNVTNFQRLLMVSSLDSISLVHPNLARLVLYAIYSNSGEMAEIRTQAVALLMRTNPPTEMLQRMAQATNFDNSDHVNAAVKSGIESASRSNVDDELARRAKKAVDLLKPTNYGLHYSYNYLRSLPPKDNLAYKWRWNHIQSAGSILPSSFFFTLRPNLGGFTQRAYKYSWMSSSMDSLVNLLGEQLVQRPNPNYTDDGSRTQRSMFETLGLSQQVHKRVEGNLYYTLHGARRFLTFDKQTITELPRMVKFASSAYRIGDSLNYTKFYNQFSLKLAFPTASGLPFLFTVEAPTVVSLVGDVRLNSYPDLANGSPEKIRPPQSLNLTADIQALFSTKTESKFGFISPFNQMHYLAGYDTNIHVHLPLRIKVDVDVSINKMFTKLQPLNPNKHHKIAEFSTLAYTTKNNILELSPVQLNDDAKPIMIKPISEDKVTFGQNMTGFAFDFKSVTQESHLDFSNIFNKFKKDDILLSAIFFDKLSSIEPYTNYSLCFNPSRSKNKFLRVILNYADVKEYIESMENDDPHQNDAIPSVGVYEHKKRVEQFLKRSTSGMRDSYAQAADLSFEFEGNSTSTYSLTGAYARSHVSQKARYLLYISRAASKVSNSKSFELALDLRGRVPNVPLGNYVEAIKSDPSSHVVARLNIGEKGETGTEIVIKGQVEKSPERIDYLMNLPISTQCLKEMNESNYILHACNNVTTRANFMDHIYFRIDYQNVAVSWQKNFYRLYSLLRYYSFPFISENILEQTNPKGRIEFDTVFSPELNSFNASFSSPTLSAHLKNVRVNKYFQPALIMHPHYTAWDRIFERVVYYGNTPRCAADNTYAITFDNKTYPVYIGRKCWHALLSFSRSSFSETPAPSENHTVTRNFEDVSILIKGTDVKERELLIILGENVIMFHSASGSPTGNFIANDQQYSLSEEMVGHFEDRSGKTLVQAYKLSTGNMRIFTPEHGLVIFYDGFRVEVQADSRYRGKIRGLCGTYDGERSTDFTTPDNHIVENPMEFTAAYTVPDGFCQEHLKHILLKNKEPTSIKQTIIPTKIFQKNNFKYSPLIMKPFLNQHPKHSKQDSLK